MSGRNVTSDPDYVRSEIRDKSVSVIDVRRPEEYKISHIPSAINLPLSELLSDDNPERIAKLVGAIGIGDSTRVVVYDNTFGALSSRVAWSLEYLGHKDVSLLGVTYDGWMRAGLDTDNTQSQSSAKEHTVKINPEIVSTVDHLESRGDKDTILLDNRERLNFLEQHIPKAVNIPYRTLASKNGIIRPNVEMKRLFENRGITKESKVITYCGSVGTLSGLAYYALKSVGIDNVRLYVRSFKEWKSLKKPTEKQSDANYWDLSAE
ncbi:MAG: rhodanese domain protein [Cenarchaeum symbiont of Oopsacas minuta]|nr:rhodanese domain protein [Cenarchaeum symbiont of Oopsacas minuta]